MSKESKIQLDYIVNKTCVIIPTYNNDGTLLNVIKNVTNYTKNIIIINDGSTDTTRSILNNLSDQYKIIHFDKNKGKGAAIQQGLREAVALGFDYAITIDSDGQHFPEDIPHFTKNIFEKGKGIIVGHRNMNQINVPIKSNFGNKFSNFWFTVNTGIKLEDTQSGYRLYPTSILNEINFLTNRFEFEIEVLVRSAWKGYNIRNLPVQVYYAAGKERISHFRPFQDFLRISILNTVLVSYSLIFYWPKRILQLLFKKETHIKIWEILINPKESIPVKSASVGLGIFMGILPVWGFQMIIALALAVIFRLNKAIVLLASNISIPPLMPFILYLSFLFGKIWLPESGNYIPFSNKMTIEDLKLNFLQYIYGSITMAITFGIISTIGTYFILIKYKKK